MSFAAQIAQLGCLLPYGGILYYLNPLSPLKVNTLLTHHLPGLSNRIDVLIWIKV